MLDNLTVQALLPATDLDRARSFYEGILGLSPQMVLPTGTFYECGQGSRLAIANNGGTPNGEHTQVAFLADDVASEVSHLRARGVVFEEYDDGPLHTVDGIARKGPITGAWFKDSEGNLIGVLHLDTAQLNSEQHPGPHATQLTGRW
jgi:catechol 2,3-dioxygenase-like lactoylglutathione lyase family enzyme